MSASKMVEGELLGRSTGLVHWYILADPGVYRRPWITFPRGAWPKLAA